MTPKLEIEFCSAEMGGVIYNETSGRETWFGREGGIYVFDYWVKPGPLANDDGESKSDFTRPVR